MGRWLAALRNGEISERPTSATDKTDKTSPERVLSVLSVPPPALSQNLLPEPLAPEFSDEDLQALFDERAAIREYDGGFPRHEAEALADEDLRLAMENTFTAHNLETMARVRASAGDAQ